MKRLQSSDSFSLLSIIMFQLNASKETCIWLALTNLVAIYPVVILLTNAYILGGIMTILAMVFSILWHINEHENGYRFFLLPDQLFAGSLVCYGLWIGLSSIIANTFVTTKIVFFTFGFFFLIVSRLAILKKDFIGVKQAEIIYVVCHTIWHSMAFLSVVVVIPENQTWYPSLIVKFSSF
jgi:hypothetical protein